MTTMTSGSTPAKVEVKKLDAPSGVNQHKAMATGGTMESGNFGIKKLSTTTK